MLLLFRMTAREGQAGVAVGACSLQDQFGIAASKKLDFLLYDPCSFCAKNG